MTAPPAGVFDPGLQPERTGLAWRRTGLALAVGSLVALRVVPGPGDGGWTLLPGLAGLGLALAVLVLGERRYRQVHRSLTRAEPVPVGGGGLVFVTALATAALALYAAVVLLSGRVLP